MKIANYFTAALVAIIGAEVHGGIILTPTTHHELSAKEALVYCPTFQLAWDELKKAVGGEIGMENQPELVAVLNQTPVPANCVPEDACMTLGGRIDEGIIRKLREQLDKKFGAAAPRLPEEFSNPLTELVAYSHLQRTLPFPRRFVRSQRIPLKFKTEAGESEVQFFGATRETAEDYSGQTTILHWESEAEFTIGLDTKREGETIILAKMARKGDLDGALARVREQLRAKHQHIQQVRVRGKEEQLLGTLCKGDLLAIPVLDMNVTTNFEALCNHALTNKGYQQSWLMGAYQDVMFTMDESGAVVKSTAYAATGFGEPEKSSIPRRFIFDTPFLLTVWRGNAESPYLAVWVATDEMMIPFKQTKKEDKPE